MGAPTVDFDGITVSLCDANNHLIVSDRAGIEAQQIITVNEGELFSVCVDFGEVTGSGPGMYSVTISLSAVDEEGEHKAQSQTWCVTASFEGGVLQFKSFRLWNFTYENHTEQGFAMPKPGGHSPSGDKRGTIRVTIERVTEEYRTRQFDPQPEIPDDTIEREDLAVGKDLYVANPHKLKPKGPTKQAKNRADFVFRNTESAYDSDEDEPNKGRIARRGSIVPRTPDSQGLKPRAAATEAIRGLSGMANYQANLGRAIGQYDESRVSPTQAYSENGIPLRKSKKNERQHTSSAHARRAQPSPEPDLDINYEEEDEGKSDEEGRSTQHVDGHTPELDSESSDEGLFVGKGAVHPPRTTEHRADSVIPNVSAEEHGMFRRSRSPKNLATPFIARESTGEVDATMQDFVSRENSVTGTTHQENPHERKRKREESELLESIVDERAVRDLAPEGLPAATMPEGPQRKTNVPRATAESPPVKVEQMEDDGRFDQSAPGSTPSHHHQPFQEDANANLDTDTNIGPGGSSLEEQTPQSGAPLAVIRGSEENLLPVQFAHPGTPPTADREHPFEKAIEGVAEASGVKHNPEHTDDDTDEQQVKQITMGMAVALGQPLANGTDPGLEKKIGVLALRINETEAKIRLHKVRMKNRGNTLEADEQYHELVLEKASMEREKYELDGKK